MLGNLFGGQDDEDSQKTLRLDDFHEKDCPKNNIAKFPMLSKVFMDFVLRNVANNCRLIIELAFMNWIGNFEILKLLFLFVGVTFWPRAVDQLCPFKTSGRSWEQAWPCTFLSTSGNTVQKQHRDTEGPNLFSKTCCNIEFTVGLCCLAPFFSAGFDFRERPWDAEELPQHFSSAWFPGSHASAWKCTQSKARERSKGRCAQDDRRQSLGKDKCSKRQRNFQAPRHGGPLCPCRSTHGWSATGWSSLQCHFGDWGAGHTTRSSSSSWGCQGLADHWQCQWRA